ncbi:hypothetical protein [Streptomyces sp. VNUA74]|uniref:hypothetical protein n=1 Tax=Streptomyces sp. VNUA74 TaxID=3062685 RepID=UPI00280BF298|nr:hypothetical protein [Streptomyces sp. VNUA74]WML79180.1 hypothetical protein Q3101_04705 [Streptomyces sp. VNUA74]
MQQPLSATPDELLEVFSEMYPKELDRAVAELTIRKQVARIKQLEEQLADAVDETAHHGHTHNDD